MRLASTLPPTEPTTVNPAATAGSPGAPNAIGTSALAHNPASIARGLAQVTPRIDKAAACRVHRRAPS
ncbi:hypothetical protein Acor_83270 [Acrocarpospora corrugata]|uniref:Uncharacterized protein n=1 Tax=Acrocarpospora corrugata TaxID=35763 RepID=A0A5M3WIR9_9ACTN|nr:hypothetical protein Acor_83270 [Acrocarpospora corrugata]